MSEIQRGYMARNRDVATAYGLRSGLQSMRARMGSRKNCPAWFLDTIDDMERRARIMIEVAIEHRDELPADPRDVRGFVDRLVDDFTDPSEPDANATTAPA